MNVPKKLEEMLLDIPRQWSEDKDQVLREYAMACAVIRQYLGKFPGDFTDPFMMNGVDEGSDLRIEHMRRVCTLADCVFALRNVSGFDVLLERFAERGTRATYFEARGAKRLFDHGFLIEMRREAGRRGSDFDFCAARSDAMINVEVTELRSPAFSARSIANKLSEKRSQFPNTHPAVLFITVRG